MFKKLFGKRDVVTKFGKVLGIWKNYEMYKKAKERS